jgi:hypothetical protein
MTSRMVVNKKRPADEGGIRNIMPVIPHAHEVLLSETREGKCS